MIARAAMVVMLMLASSCAMLGGRDRGGYSGPAHLEPHARDAINAAIVGFRELHGLELTWKWDQWKIRIIEEPVVGHYGGYPAIAWPGPDGVAGAYFSQRTQTIHVPNSGLRRDTLVHEMGHMLLWYNGYRLLDESPQGHHKRFAAFFRRYSYGGGRVL